VAADFVIHGGDLFFRSKVPAKIVDLVYQSLLDFAESGIPLFIVPGNHERSNLPVSLLLGHPNIFIFDTPKTFTFKIARTIFAISGFPFVCENISGRFKSILLSTGRETGAADVKLLCIHQAVEGAQVGAQNYTFRNGKDIVRIKDIPPDFLAVLSGHIHSKQILMIPSSKDTSSSPVIYCGSTERTSFAERLEDKGFFDIELSQSNENIWGIHCLNFIKLPTRPMVDLYLDVSIDKNTLKPYLLSKISRINPNAIVRLKCHGNLDDQVRAILTSAFLREILPKTMNVEFR